MHPQMCKIKPLKVDNSQQMKHKLFAVILHTGCPTTTHASPKKKQSLTILYKRCPKEKCRKSGSIQDFSDIHHPALRYRADILVRHENELAVIAL